MQKSFSDLEYALKKKQTRRDRFLSEIAMESLGERSGEALSKIGRSWPPADGTGTHAADVHCPAMLWSVG